MKFVSDLRQVDGFLQVLQFPPPINHRHNNPLSIVKWIIPI